MSTHQAQWTALQSGTDGPKGQPVTAGVRALVDVDGERIRPGDRVSFPADTMSHDPGSAPAFIYAGFCPDDPRMILITNVSTNRCSTVAPVVIGAHFTDAGDCPWNMTSHRTAEDLMKRWRQTRDSAEAAWEEILADNIRRHPAYLHPVYPAVPAIAQFWAVDGKRGPVWDNADVRLIAEDGTELCTFDLGDDPETTAALEALTELFPPKWAEDERATLL
ncbi:hypothetical protein ACWC0C_19875 [Streptomyces sp. NPDC001709]